MQEPPARVLGGAHAEHTPVAGLHAVQKGGRLHVAHSAAPAPAQVPAAHWVQPGLGLPALWAAPAAHWVQEVPPGATPCPSRQVRQVAVLAPKNRPVLQEVQVPVVTLQEAQLGEAGESGKGAWQGKVRVG